MKKVLAVLLTAILAFTALTAAAENPSPEKLSGVIVSVSGKDADGNTLKLAVENTEIAQSTYTDALNNLKKEVGDDNLKIVDQKQLVLKEGSNPKFPLTVDLKVPGVKPTSKVFVLFKASANQAEGLSNKAADGEVIGLSATTSFKIINLAEVADVQKLDAVAGTDKVTVTFNALGEFVLVTDAQTVASITEAAKDDTKSPQTSDKATPVMVALFAVAAVLAVVSVKKIRTAA
ncbi:MAG: hypothetical protein U0L66_09745 [Acutalibacteraceae bacterium]|nr:hypothetical protein [Acutalibacteraceae bacterium]